METITKKVGRADFHNSNWMQSEYPDCQFLLNGVSMAWQVI